MLTTQQRIARLYENSTSAARAAINEYRAELEDPKLLDTLEQAPQPLSHGALLDALIHAVRDRAIG